MSNARSLRLVALGVGDAFSELFYSCSSHLSCEGRGLLVDAPHPIRKMLREARISSGEPMPIEAIDALVLTHLHGDHASGVESLAYFFRFGLERRLPVACHADVRARLWDGHLAAGMEQLLDASTGELRDMSFDDYFTWIELKEDAITELGPWLIEPRRTLHHIPTTALRIGAGGHRIGFSADTAFDPSLIEWLADCDLILHETNLGVHTPYADLAALPAELRERMRLVHYTDDFDRSASVIRPLQQGECITLGER